MKIGWAGSSESSGVAGSASVNNNPYSSALSLVNIIQNIIEGHIFR
jgi:hypothetical protein